jgi:hypothetical protein
MITENTTMFYRADGGIVCSWDGKPYSVTKESNPENWETITAYLAEHPEALVPEPQPPEPSVGELSKMKSVQDEAKELDLDMKWIREQRKKAKG